MNKIPVLFYNTIIRYQIYPKRWLKILNIILEKEKALILRKLRTMQLIEADLQLIIRNFIGGRNNKNIAAGKRLSKYNCGSRKYYSIDTAILEKRLMRDATIRNS